MHQTLKNVLAIVAGIVIGSLVNMGIIMLSGSIIPPPEGINVMDMDMDDLKDSMHLFQPRHFIMPFLAHALGTLAGAFLAAKIAATRKMRIALVVGVFFLIGGIANAFMLPSPIWFIVLDLVAAYLPMGWLGGRFAIRNT